jgi:DNA-binding IclR family transcriptional regulator
MQSVRDELDETVHLCQVDGGETVFLEAIETNRSLKVSSRVGERLPAYATAAGKVLLAELSSEQLRALFPERSLLPQTDRTIATRSQLETELKQIRESGYATNFGESENGVTAIAVPIRDPRGRAVFALASSIPSSRITQQDAPRVAAVLTVGAQKIGEFLP